MTVGRRGSPQQVGETVDIGEVGQVQPGAVVGETGGARGRSEPVYCVRVRISPVRRPATSSPPLSHHRGQAVTLTVDQTWKYFS